MSSSKASKRASASEPKDDLRHFVPTAAPSWFSSCSTEEELEARCERDFEESYAFHQQAIADGTYTPDMIAEAGTLASKRLFRARTIMGLKTRNAVEERWARKVIAEHVGSLIDARLHAAGVAKNDRHLIRKLWCEQIFRCKPCADPEQIVWAEYAAQHEKWF